MRWGDGDGVVPQLINNDHSLDEHLALSRLTFASRMCDEKRILTIIKTLEYFITCLQTLHKYVYTTFV